MRTTALLLMVLLSACGKSADKAGSASAPSPVKGTVTVGGKPVTVTKCIVEKHMDTRLSLVFDGGSIAYEDDHLYYYKGNNADGMMKGSLLTCEKYADAHNFGTSTDKPGWARGTMSADCSGPTPVQFDVELLCGEVSPEQQKDIDKMTKEMRDMQAKMAADGSGSAAGNSLDVGSAGSAGSGASAGSAGLAGSAGSAGSAAGSR